MTLSRWLTALIFVACLAKFYDITAPWARKDHYNYGGVHTSKMVECFKKVPLAESKGIVITDCEAQPFSFYRNHPPTIIWMISGLTDLLNSQREWVYRLFGIFFSLLNLSLMYVLARQWRPDDQNFPLWVCAFHSLSLFGLFFGSHTDFISEFALTPLLASMILALRGRESLAGLGAIIGGLFSWPGFLHFAALFSFNVLTKKIPWRTVILGAIGFFCGLGLMLWLRQTGDLGAFIQEKLTKPGYVPTSERDLLYPLRWILKSLQQNSWLLSPAFFFLVLTELATRTLRREWTRESLARTSLIAGAGLMYVALGRDFFYIHAFLYLYLTPFFSITAAEAINRLLHSPSLVTVSRGARAWPVGIVLVCLLAYPYGILKTHLVHDAVNSLVLLGGGIALALLWLRSVGTSRAPRLAAVALVVAASGFGNISQMISYRNEPPRDAQFCQEARREHSQTGSPVRVPPDLPPHFTRAYYCAGIPLEDPL